MGLACRASALSSMSYNFTSIPLTDRHTAVEFALRNLLKFSKYVVVVRGFNRYGEGPLSQPVTVWTLEDGKYFFFLSYPVDIQ